MDWLGIQVKLIDAVKKYKYALLVLILGLMLMLLPRMNDDQKATPATEPVQMEAEEDVEGKLARILAKIKGAGEVEVMLTIASGERIQYQTDQELSEGEHGNTRFDTVIITGADRGQSGLIQQVEPPTYLGAIVVCRGADSPAVRLAIVEAVSKVTGLGADKISVLKMK